MFPNCIDRFGCQKRETKVQQANKEKTKEKMEIIVPIMNRYPRNGQEGDLEFSAR